MADSGSASAGVSAGVWLDLLRSAHDAVFVADAQTGEIVDCNRAAELLCGRSRGDLIGAAQTSLHPPGEAQRYFADFIRYGGEPGGVKWRSVLVDSGGRHIPVEITSGVAEADARRLIMGIFHDLRERYPWPVLEADRYLYEAFVDAPLPIMLHAEDGQVVMLSREWMRLTGYTLEDIPTVDAWLRAAYGPEVAEIRSRGIDEAYHSEGPALQGEFGVRTASAETRIWKFYASPLGRLADGRRVLLSMAIDVSDQRRAEARRLEGAKKLQQSLTATVQAMARAMAKRDPYTAGHQERVARVAQTLARELGLDAQRVRGVRMGAAIHDVGKIYVPSEILNRPGPLTTQERALIRTHSEVGYDIVRHIEFPWPVADMILQHHERMDGSGYPNGLRGEAICLEARILAVADVVEAMASYRPYRPALGMDSALAEIEQNSGHLYDADVSQACLRLVTRYGAQLLDKG